jgi:putative hemolysin
MPTRGFYPVRTNVRFAIEQGGSYTLATADTAATCTLADGRTVDAWGYFRANASAAG